MLSDAARERLLAHDWPGNIRELQNTIERAFALSTSDTIELADIAPALPPHERAPGATARSATLEAVPAGSAGEEQPATAATDASADVAAAPSATDIAEPGVISLEEAERRAIFAALRQSGGNKNEAARLLKIDRQRLYRKIEKYRL